MVVLSGSSLKVDAQQVCGPFPQPGQKRTRCTRFCLGCRASELRKHGDEAVVGPVCSCAWMVAHVTGRNFDALLSGFARPIILASTPVYVQDSPAITTGFRDQLWAHTDPNLLPQRGTLASTSRPPRLRSVGPPSHISGNILSTGIVGHRLREHKI